MNYGLYKNMEIYVPFLPPLDEQSFCKGNSVLIYIASKTGDETRNVSVPL